VRIRVESGARREVQVRVPRVGAVKYLVAEMARTPSSAVSGTRVTEGASTCKDRRATTEEQAAQVGLAEQEMPCLLPPTRMVFFALSWSWVRARQLRPTKDCGQHGAKILWVGCEGAADRFETVHVRRVKEGFAEDRDRLSSQ
jgi:hypothetical protein